MVVISNDILSDGSVVRSSANGVSVLPLKWKPRKVSAVRDFPQGCGPIVQPVNVVSQESGESKSTEDGRLGLIVEPLNVEMETLVNAVVQVDDVKLMSPTHGTENGDSVIKEAIPNTKFPQRRVSAVRDFPPYCGLDAAEPTEEERIRINGRRIVGTNVSVKDEFLQKTQSVESTNETGEPKNGLDTGQTCQELVVYTRDKSMKKTCSVDAYAEDSEEAFQDESVQNSVALQIDKTLAQIQKDIININDQPTKAIHEKRPKNRSIKITNNQGFVGDETRVILGLMAPSVHLPDMDDSPKRKKGKGQMSVTPKKKSIKKKPSSIGDNVAYTGTLDMVLRDEEKFVDFEDEEEFPTSHGAHDVDVMPPPFGPKSSNDARNKVRETLRLFQALCRKLLQGEEAKTKEGDESKPIKRIDLAARNILIEKGRAPDRVKKMCGPTPGVEVGDEFQYRAELALVGIHWRLQDGIDYVKQGKDQVALSVVASGGYDNELGKPECLTYCGSGGIGKDKKVEDQKLHKGNLALKNNIHLKLPVRVIRGYKSKSTESSNSKSRASITYIYDGLYTVEKYWQEPGPLGNLVYKFELKRIPGQPELALREVKSKKFRTREGLIVNDISGGKEVFRICAVNTINDEKPPSFTYITKIVYPDWYQPLPPKGCDCAGRCSDKRCSCAFKNGGEIPYNHNGAIVEAKPLVYECGPSCRCPPTCYNRVTQQGMKIQLEIFKTESRGWGVRSLSSIPSGSFICEYIGEFLEDKEAEKRTGNDEYLFDIGQNYNDFSLNPDTKSSSGEIILTGGFTIDAANYGNVGRFINHSCSPNLYAQNVLYDQEDKRMPHIMLFAAENIPPLQELTYHYNYAVDTVHDSDGNIKIKNCYCGSSECTGRLY